MTAAQPYISEPSCIRVHVSGCCALPRAKRIITCLPLYDGRYFARLGHGPASEWLAAAGMRLPTIAEYDELADIAETTIKPVTLPTADMLRNVPRPLYRADGKDSPALARYRAEHMRTENWCRVHDVEVWSRLGRAGWRGEGPVAHAGKWWAIGSRGPSSPCIYGWDGIQPESYAHLAEPLYTDYATLFHGVLDDA